MDLKLGGMTVVITGASGGIGWSTAETFAAEGARLALHASSRVDVLRGRVDSLAGDDAARDEVSVHGGDLRRVADADALLAAARGHHGRVDVVVVNAGVWPATGRRLDTMDPERIVDVLDLNLRGAIWTARAFLRTLAETGPRADGRGASLLFVGSTAGRFGEAGHAAYAASKAALAGLVRTLKNEIVHLDPYARVNMVEPGWTATPMARDAMEAPGAIEGVARTMSLRQIARPVDIARALAVLASPAASRHVTGEILTVAGGMEGRTLWERDDVDPAAVRARLDDD